MTTPTLLISRPFMTIHDLLHHAVPRSIAAGLVFGHGGENAYDGAVYLILHMLHLSIDTLGSFLDARPLPEEMTAMLKVVKRRAVDRMPVAYTTYEAFMHSMCSYVDKRVVVPCSFIGELLEDGLEPRINREDGPADVLELCTNSGCPLILAALQWPNSTIDVMGLSLDALMMANRDVDEYHLQNRIRPYGGDPHASLPLGVHYSMTPTNSPYANGVSMQALPPEYRVEPHMVLAGDNDGMDTVHRILAGAPHHPGPHGVLVVEIDNERENAETTFPDLDLIWLPTSVGEDQVSLVTREAL